MKQFLVEMLVMVEAENEEVAAELVSDAYFYGLSDACGKNDGNMRQIGISVTEDK
jgi:hypothetical protein